jgi:hypothetical protein
MTAAISIFIADERGNRFVSGKQLHSEQHGNDAFDAYIDHQPVKIKMPLVTRKEVKTLQCLMFVIFAGTKRSLRTR